MEFLLEVWNFELKCCDLYGEFGEDEGGFDYGDEMSDMGDGSVVYWCVVVG